MAKYISLFGGTTTDTTVQVVKENQIVIGFGPYSTTNRYVVYKVEHTEDGYMYHLLNLETKKTDCTDILQPLSCQYGIGKYYDDKNPQFMDAFEVAALASEAERLAAKKADAEAQAQAEHDRIARIGAERLENIMPENVQGVILAELNETQYTDPSYECRETQSVRTVILGFSTTTRNGFGELRRAARNLPETASLAEYNKDYEHRYPCFTLGKSPYSGWSIHKMSYYTRKGFIDMLAYTAGDEANIRLSNATAERSDKRPETVVQGHFVIVDYSDKAIAVFGDTKPIKAELSVLGGRFNSRLTYEGQKKAGWIFQKTKEAQVRKLIGKNE